MAFVTVWAEMMPGNPATILPPTILPAFLTNVRRSVGNTSLATDGLRQQADRKTIRTGRLHKHCSKHIESSPTANERLFLINIRSGLIQQSNAPPDVSFICCSISCFASAQLEPPTNRLCRGVQHASQQLIG